MLDDGPKPSSEAPKKKRKILCALQVNMLGLSFFYPRSWFAVYEQKLYTLLINWLEIYMKIYERHFPPVEWTNKKQ